MTRPKVYSLDFNLFRLTGWIELRKQIMASQKNYAAAKDSAEAESLVEKIRRDYYQARDVTNEKIKLSDKAMDLLQRHIKRLDETLAEAIKNVDDAALSGGQMFDATPTVDKSTHVILICPLTFNCNPLDKKKNWTILRYREVDHGNCHEPDHL